MRHVLERFKRGELSLPEAERLLLSCSVGEVGSIAKLDLGREARTFVPEAVFAQTKKPADLLRIAKKMRAGTGSFLLTRVTQEQYRLLKKNFTGFSWNERGRVFSFGGRRERTGRIGLLCAGTSDLPVAEEAKAAAEHMGCEVLCGYDVGIAGIHRLFPVLRKMIDSGVRLIIVVAGMEGTLPGVVASLCSKPVIGVPTSTGYGLGANGIGALTTMLQSCSPGLLVVNIDNGFGAAAAAAKLLRNV